MNRMSTSTCNMTPLFENHYIFKRLHWRLKGKNSKLLNAKIWKDHFIAKQISNLVRNKMYQIFKFFLICLSCQISTFITFTSTNITFDQQFANLRTQEGSLQAQKKQWLIISTRLKLLNTRWLQWEGKSFVNKEINII